MKTVVQVVGRLELGTVPGDWWFSANGSLMRAPQDGLLVWRTGRGRDGSPKFTQSEPHFSSNKFAASKSVAKASHLCANPSNLFRSASVRAVCANSRHRLALSRQAFGSPVISATLMFRYGHRHVEGGAEHALEGQGSQLTHYRVPLGADQPGDSSAFSTGGTVDQIASYEFNGKHRNLLHSLFSRLSTVT
jgi:hypothetical protein